MRNLILDCSCGMGVYLDLNGEVISYVDKTQNKHSDEILKIIDNLLIESNTNIKNIDNICVCVGPGSFTGVRVAISIAKGLAIGTNAKVFTLTNFDIFDAENHENFYIVLDGFSSFVYSRKSENGCVKDECIDVEDLIKDIGKTNYPVYVTTEKTQNMLKNYEIQSKIIQNVIISAFNEKNNSGESVELNQIYPVYLRASQAEIEREKRM